MLDAALTALTGGRAEDGERLRVTLSDAFPDREFEVRRGGQTNSPLQAGLE